MPQTLTQLFQFIELYRFIFVRMKLRAIPYGALLKFPLDFAHFLGYSFLESYVKRFTFIQIKWKTCCGPDNAVNFDNKSCWYTYKIHLQKHSSEYRVSYLPLASVVVRCSVENKQKYYSIVLFKWFANHVSIFVAEFARETLFIYTINDICAISKLARTKTEPMINPY